MAIKFISFMLTIRLQRAGKRNRPEYRIVLAQKTAAASKKFVEVLGNYNPRNKDFSVKSEDRLKYWIAQHVEISATVHNLLVTKNLITEKKIKSFTIPKKEVKAEEPAAQAPVAEAASAPAPEASSEPATTAEPEVAPVEAPAEVQPVDPTPAPTEAPAA